MNKAAKVESQGEINWADYTIAELEGFLEEITGEIKRQREIKRVELRDRIREMVEQEGLTLSQVMGWPIRAGKRQGARVKYRHPSGAAWSGRGRQPRWLAEELAAGKNLQDFAL